MNSAHVRMLYDELARTRSPDEARRAVARVLGYEADDLLPAPRPPRTKPATTPTRRHSRSETCPRGHDADDVIVRANGTRTCRPCHRASVRRYEKKRVRCRFRATGHGLSRCKCPKHLRELSPCAAVALCVRAKGDGAPFY